MTWWPVDLEPRDAEPSPGELAEDAARAEGRLAGEAALHDVAAQAFTEHEELRALRELVVALHADRAWLTWQLDELAAA